MRFAVALTFGAMLLSSTAHAADAARWWKHVETLAADDMEGRFTGSAGYLRAARYVAAEFAKAGLAPAGTDGFLQAVPLKEQIVGFAGSKVWLVGADGKGVALSGSEMILGTRIPQLATVDAPLVFIGYGMHMPDAGYDDFAGVDLKGKIAVFLSTGGPKAMSGSLRSHARSAELYPALERAGAVGAITISDPKTADVPWERTVAISQTPGMYLAEPAYRAARGSMFTGNIKPEEAGRLFAGSGTTLEQIRAMAAKGEKLPGIALKQRIKAEVKATQRDVSSPNVAGLMKGSDPALAGQYVVLTAHLDGLGIGAPVNGDKIYNGAMDNASGVASLIEAATALKARKPKRSILFVAVTSEERGLLGSRWFAERPTVAKTAVVANINMDMYLPLSPFDGATLLGIEESNLAGPARAVAAAVNVPVVPDPEPDRNLFVRSDQYSFVRTGVPALALKFATPPGSEAMKLNKAWLTARYHAPSDDIAQPVDRAGAAKFNDFLVDLIARVADMQAKPAWNNDSFFRRFAK